ncbi:unnamed protein product [Calicophoron daubneyi]|uniref:Leucine-rich repeat-containing protein 42 n=1 Tax=Calicophoron daubneyi TaxID=300641 RepID=A0AAV2TM25_CALDB
MNDKKSTLIQILILRYRKTTAYLTQLVVHLLFFQVVNLDSTREAIVFMSLLHICCIRFSELLPIVDCLEGLPEHLGKCVFERIAHRYSTSSVDNEVARIFHLFIRAYGESFLEALHFTNHPEMLTKWIRLIHVADSLKYLYLDDCEIGTKYPEILPIVGRLKHLAQLSLQNNSLCNDHIRALTAASRFSRQSSLRCLDLSGNGFLSERCLASLSQLKSLRETHCSDTGMAVSYKKLRFPPGWVALTDSRCLLVKRPSGGWFNSFCPIPCNDEPVSMFEDPLTIVNLHCSVARTF